MEVSVKAYKGPLDLLLQLIRRNEIDIYDIPIAELTDQYLEVIAMHNMDQISEFLVMAATLLEIKSRMLLPRPKNEDNNEPEDPREALVQKLLAYQHAQTLAELIKNLEPPGPRLLGCGQPELLKSFDKSTKPDMGNVTLLRLWNAFTDVLQRQASKLDAVRIGFGELPRERFTVSEKIAHIKYRLNKYKKVSLSDLFKDCGSRNEMIVTFLAMLEMIRRGFICSSQETSFGEVDLYLA